MVQAATTYNGWTNWETWSAYNWLTVDEGTYRTARRCYSPANLAMYAQQEQIVNDFDTDDEYDEVNWDEVYAALSDE